MLKKVAKLAVLATVAAGLNIVAAVPASAQTGFLCGFTSEYDPTLEGDTQTGEIDGGPLFATDVDNPGEETAEIEIVCTIQVGSQGATHAGADAVVAHGTRTAAVTTLTPTLISYASPFGAPVYLCTQAVVNGVIRYYDADNEGVADDFVGWTTSNAGDCGLALYQDLGVSGRCDISDPRLLCRTNNGTLCAVWINGACLTPIPGA